MFVLVGNLASLAASLPPSHCHGHRRFLPFLPLPSQTVACVSPPIPMRRGTRSVSPSLLPPSFSPSLFSFLSVLYWPLCVMFLLGTPTRSLAHFVLLPPLLPTTETKAERESGRVGVESSPLFMNETRPPLSLSLLH